MSAGLPDGGFNDVFAGMVTCPKQPMTPDDNVPPSDFEAR